MKKNLSLISRTSNPFVIKLKDHYKQLSIFKSIVIVLILTFSRYSA